MWIQEQKIGPRQAGAAQSGKLLADFGTVLFRKVEIAKRAMKVHPRSQHVRIDDENLFAVWTSHFDGLTHDSSSG
jgi:hypothetical protein